MSYIFGKLWHLAIIWAIRKAFQCILQGIRFLLAKQTWLSGTSDNESYIDHFTNIPLTTFAGRMEWFLKNWQLQSWRKSLISLGVWNRAITKSTAFLGTLPLQTSSRNTSSSPCGPCRARPTWRLRRWSTQCRPWWRNLGAPLVFFLGFLLFRFGTIAAHQKNCYKPVVNNWSCISRLWTRTQHNERRHC